MYRSKVFKHALQTQNTIGTQTITGASILTNLISKQPRFFLAHFPTEETLCELKLQYYFKPCSSETDKGTGSCGDKERERRATVRRVRHLSLP